MTSSILFVHGLQDFSLAYWTIRQAVDERCEARFSFFQHQYVCNEANNQEQFRLAVSALQPRFVLFSCHGWTLKPFIELARWTKILAPAAQTVLGGPQVRGRRAATTLLAASGWIDCIITGAGELSIPPLLDAKDANALSCIPNLTYRQQDTVVHGPEAGYRWKRPSLFNANNIELTQFLHGIQQVSYETTRGCTNQCTYCQYPEHHGGLQFLDMELMKQELTFLCQFRIPHIRICDAHFGGTADRAKQLLTHLSTVNRSSSIKLYPALDHLDDEYLDLVKRARAQITSVGIQSTHPDALRAIRRSPIRKYEKQIKQMLRRYPETPADVIIGLPGDNLDGLRTTLQDVLRLGFQRVHAFRLTVFPGTSLSHNVPAALGAGEIANSNDGVILASGQFPAPQQPAVAKLVMATEVAAALRMTTIELEQHTQTSFLDLLENVDAAVLAGFHRNLHHWRSPVLLLRSIPEMLKVLEMRLPAPGLPNAVTDALCFDVLVHANVSCAEHNRRAFPLDTAQGVERVREVVLISKQKVFYWRLNDRRVEVISNDVGRGKERLSLHISPDYSMKETI